MKKDIKEAEAETGEFPTNLSQIREDEQDSEDEENKPRLKAGKDYKVSFLRDQAIYRTMKPAVEERMHKFSSRTISQRNNCSPKFAESSMEERKIDSKLTKLKLGRIVDVMKTPRISHLLEIARNVKAKQLV